MRRSNLSPDALTAAMNLQMYDEAWTRLRTEYIEVSLERPVEVGWRDKC